MGDAGRAGAGARLARHEERPEPPGAAAEAARSLLGDGTSGFAFAGPNGRPVDKIEGRCRQSASTWALIAPRRTTCRRTHGTMITKLSFGRDAMNRIQNHREGGIASVYDRHGYAEENQRIMEAVATR